MIKELGRMLMMFGLFSTGMFMYVLIAALITEAIFGDTDFTIITIFGLMIPIGAILYFCF